MVDVYVSGYVPGDYASYLKGQVVPASTVAEAMEKFMIIYPTAYDVTVQGRHHSREQWRALGLEPSPDCVFAGERFAPADMKHHRRTAEWADLVLSKFDRFWMKRREYRRDPLEPESWGMNRAGEWNYGGVEGVLPEVPKGDLCRRFRLFADEIARERIAVA